MPPRTNEEQEVIALLRPLLARDGCEVTESAMLRNDQTGDEREVDIVMLCQVSDDVTIRVCCEVMAQKHPVDVRKVEGLLRKHAGLRTNSLILVSWSGFTDGALRTGNASTEPVTQMVHVRRDAGGSIALFQDEVALTPRGMVFVVETPRGPLRVRAVTDQALFWADGEELPENASEVATVLLNRPDVIKMTLTEAHNHPERDSLRSFRFQTGLPDRLQLFLREEPSGELHRIIQVELEGEFAFKQTPIDLRVSSFGELPFGHGRTELGGRKAMMVTRLGDQKELMPGFMVRVYDKGKEPKPARGDHAG